MADHLKYQDIEHAFNVTGTDMSLRALANFYDQFSRKAAIASDKVCMGIDQFTSIMHKIGFIHEDFIASSFRALMIVNRSPLVPKEVVDNFWYSIVDLDANGLVSLGHVIYAVGVLMDRENSRKGLTQTADSRMRKVPQDSYLDYADDHARGVSNIGSGERQIISVDILRRLIAPDEDGDEGDYELMSLYQKMVESLVYNLTQ